VSAEPLRLFLKPGNFGLFRKAAPWLGARKSKGPGCGSPGAMSPPRRSRWSARAWTWVPKRPGPASGGGREATGARPGRRGQRGPGGPPWLWGGLGFRCEFLFTPALLQRSPPKKVTLTVKFSLHHAPERRSGGAFGPPLAEGSARGERSGRQGPPRWGLGSLARLFPARASSFTCQGPGKGEFWQKSFDNAHFLLRGKRGGHRV
jgi:hypothetical protein